MIIGLSGYIGSGKDTVGQIIQYLDVCKKFPHRKVDFVEGDVFVSRNTEFQIKKFAAKLKQVASILTGFPAEKFEDQEFKKTYLPREWNYNPEGEDWIDGKPQEWQLTVREFLQKLGTEAIRNNIHTNAWVNALFADYKSICYHDNDIGKYPDWIITDCRFPNEAQAIKDRGGMVVRIERNLPTVEYQTLEQRHPSETSLNDWNFDYIINNNRTIEDLTELVREMLNHFSLLTPH